MYDEMMKRQQKAKEAEEAGKAVMKAVGCASIAEMRAMPAAELLEKAGAASMQKMYNIDGYFFTEQPVDTYNNGRQAHVPLLVGWNSAEMPIAAVLGGRPMTVASVREAVKSVFGDDTDKVLAAINDPEKFVIVNTAPSIRASRNNIRGCRARRRRRRARAAPREAPRLRGAPRQCRR